MKKRHMISIGPTEKKDEYVITTFTKCADSTCAQSIIIDREQIKGIINQAYKALEHKFT